MRDLAIDYSILFPTPMLVLGTTPQPELEVALARGYNRWLVRNVLPSSEAIKTMLYLPLSDPDASASFIEEFADEPGVLGFLVTCVRYQPIHENRFMKVFAALDERGLPLAFHSAPNWGERSFEQLNSFIGVHALGFPFYAMVQLTNLVYNGIPERFPNVPVIFMEAGILVARVHGRPARQRVPAALVRGAAADRMPSDYIRDFFYTSQPIDPLADPEHNRMLFELFSGETQLLYSSDYPHQDFDTPSTIDDLSFLSAEARRNILGGNAAKLFGLADVKLQRAPPGAVLRCGSSTPARARRSPRSSATARTRPRGHGRQRARARLGSAPVARAQEPRPLLGGDRRGGDRRWRACPRACRTAGGAAPATSRSSRRARPSRAFFAYAALNPYDDPGAADAVAGLKERGAVGIVVEPGIADEPAYVDDPRIDPLCEACLGAGLPLLIMAGGEAGPDLSYCDPVLLDRLAIRHPQLQIVNVHGGWPLVQGALGVAFRRKNVWYLGDVYFPNLPGEADIVLRDADVPAGALPLLERLSVLPAEGRRRPLPRLRPPGRRARERDGRQRRAALRDLSDVPHRACTRSRSRAPSTQIPRLPRAIFDELDRACRRALRAWDTSRPP